MKKLLIVLGTRPEAIKLSPVLHCAKDLASDFETLVCVTSQHQEMLSPMLELFEIEPDVDLELMQENQELSPLTEATLSKVTRTLKKIRPDVVLVQGDTTTAMATALAGYYEKIPVGHVEAGLRTGNIYNPFPEEINRKVISTLSSYNFAPTRRARETLLREGCRAETVFLTGNTAVDALHMVQKIGSPKNQTHDTRSLKHTILVTAHRRENFGEPLKKICSALKSLAKRNPDMEIVYPVHLNPNVKNVVYTLLSDTRGITLLEPLGYREFIDLLSRCFLVLTDSGGIQEEAPALGKPVLVMRKETERPEGIRAGVAKLVGTEVEDIVQSVKTLLEDREAYERMSKAANPYGDGHAAERIVEVLHRGKCSEWSPPL